MARHSADANALESLLAGPGSASDASAHLLRLAELATAVRDVAVLERPDPVFITTLREELVATITAGSPGLVARTRDLVDETTARWRHSLRIAGASATASLLIASTGVAAAAQSALPGDVLYSVKLFTEDARLALATGDVEQGRLHLAFAEERLQEVEAGLHRLSSTQITDTLTAFDTEAASGADQLLAASIGDPTSDALAELTTFTDSVRERLLAVIDDVPLAARPAAERSLEVLRRIDVQVGGLLAPVACEACGALTDLDVFIPRVVLPGDGPAAPLPCDCIGGPSTGGPAPTVPLVPPADDRDGTDPDPGDDAQPAPTPPADDSSESGGLLDDVTGELTDELPDEVDEVVEPIDDVGSLVDDLLGDTELADVVDEVDEDVGDLIDDLGATTDVEGTVDDGLGGTVGDLLGG